MLQHFIYSIRQVWGFSSNKGIRRRESTYYDMGLLLSFLVHCYAYKGRLSCCNKGQKCIVHLDH